MVRSKTCLAALALALCLCGGAAATPEWTPDPTLRYRVVDVAANDVLNIRRQPDLQAQIIGKLEPYAREIVVAGTRAEVGGSVWWQVVTAQGTGWVNARYLQPVDVDAEGEQSFPLRCTGTEPFWSLGVDGASAMFTTPERSKALQAGPMTLAHGLRGRYAVQLRDKAQTGHLALWRNPALCSDGMSDWGFPFEAVLALPDGAVHAGCCMRAGAQK